MSLVTSRDGGEAHVCGLTGAFDLFLAAVIVVWRLRGEGGDRGTRAVRLFGVTFFALARYLAVESIRDLAIHAGPGQSATGLTVAGATVIVMPGLAVAKRRTGHALGNRSLPTLPRRPSVPSPPPPWWALGLDTGLGWWWADPAPRASGRLRRRFPGAGRRRPAW